MNAMKNINAQNAMTAMEKANQRIAAFQETMEHPKPYQEQKKLYTVLISAQPILCWPWSMKKGLR